MRQCLKQTTVAIVYHEEKQRLVNIGMNGIANESEELEVCPREEQGFKTGEGYHLCKEVCKQSGHAEVEACLDPDLDPSELKGATLYLIGHTYVCNHCQWVMKKKGLKDYVIAATGERHML